VGNAAYAHIEQLATPVNDAEDIAAALRKLGYTVDLRLNVTITQMEEAVGALVDRLSLNTENEGFIWYAGHGVQVEGENYLLPVDIRADRISQVRRQAYSLNDLLAGLEGAGNMVNVVILDACRNNPLPAESRSLSRGLAAVPVIQDTFVMFSTAAGSTAADGAPGARNSPFTEAFLKYIDKPDSLDEVAKDVARETMSKTRVTQRPFISDNILYIRNYSLSSQEVRRIAAYAGAKQTIDLGAGRSLSSASSLALMEISTITPGTVEISGDGVEEAAELPGWGTLSVVSVSPGTYTISIIYPDGNKETRRISINGSGEFVIDFSYRIIIAGPGPAGYALDRTRAWGLGASYSANPMQMNKPGVDMRYTFFEGYGNYGTGFFIPNAFFVSLRYSQSGLDAVAGRTMHSFTGGLGALYRIRLGEAQRLLLSAGISVNALYGSLDYEFNDGTRRRVTESFIDPLAGIHGGISFRFSPLLALDLNLGYFLDLLGDYPLQGPQNPPVNFSSFQASLGLSFRVPYSGD
jgi:hypothetical protein